MPLVGCMMVRQVLSLLRQLLFCVRQLYNFSLLFTGVPIYNTADEKSSNAFTRVFSCYTQISLSEDRDLTVLLRSCTLFGDRQCLTASVQLGWIPASSRLLVVRNAFSWSWLIALHSVRPRGLRMWRNYRTKPDPHLASGVLLGGSERPASVIHITDPINFPSGRPNYRVTTASLRPYLTDDCR